MQVSDEMVEKALAQYGCDQFSNDTDAMRAAITAALAAMWRPTHRHKKRGTSYMEVGRGFAQVSDHPIEEMTAVSIYRGADGLLWVRNAVEFDDGRFETLPSPPAKEK